MNAGLLTPLEELIQQLRGGVNLSIIGFGTRTLFSLSSRAISNPGSNVFEPMAVSNHFSRLDVPHSRAVRRGKFAPFTRSKGAPHHVGTGQIETRLTSRFGRDAALHESPLIHLGMPAEQALLYAQRGSAGYK